MDASKWVSMGSGCSRQLTLPLSIQENHKLRDQNDDLNGQILSLSLYEAKNLFSTQTKAQSLAAEIDTASRDEVLWPRDLTSGPGPPLSLVPIPAGLSDEPWTSQSRRSKPGPGSPESPSAATPTDRADRLGGVSAGRVKSVLISCLWWEELEFGGRAGIES